MSRCTHFTHAIVRTPADSAVHGLRAADTGAPDLARFREQHGEYLAALRSTGARVQELPALEAFPDSVFVEDAALCFAQGAVVMRPGAPSRLGEAAAITPVLEEHFTEVVAIQGPGFIEGGDVLTTGREILVGRSGRTDGDGIVALVRLVAPWGHTVREVQTPAGVLHFKTECSALDDETILTTARLDATGCFAGYRVVHTTPGEEAAANAIRFNEIVILPAGFPRTAGTLTDMGFEVREVVNSEAARLDAGMSCMSLRFSPAGQP